MSTIKIYETSNKHYFGMKRIWSLLHVYMNPLILWWVYFCNTITQLFLANVLVGIACSQPQQCTGTDHSGVCSYGFCQCKQGYLQVDGTCYQGTQMKKIDNFY